MFTHSVLLASSSPDDVEERGPISADEALQLLRTFPFVEELGKRSKDPDLMVPTITFTNQSQGIDLAIWSEAPNEFTVWLPSCWSLAQRVTDRDAVEKCVTLFFKTRIAELAEHIAALGPSS